MLTIKILGFKKKTTNVKKSGRISIYEEKQDQLSLNMISVSFTPKERRIDVLVAAAACMCFNQLM